MNLEMSFVLVIHTAQSVWYACFLCPAAQYVLLGAEEGLFSLHVVPNNPDPVMEQVCVCVWTCTYL